MPGGKGFGSFFDLQGPGHASFGNRASPEIGTMTARALRQPVFRGAWMAAHPRLADRMQAVRAFISGQRNSGMTGQTLSDSANVALDR